MTNVHLPKEIKLSIRCIWGSFILTQSGWVFALFAPYKNLVAQHVTDAAQMAGMPVHNFILLYLVGLLIRGGLLYLILANLAKGKNWARLICLIICISQIPLYHFYKNLEHEEITIIAISGVTTILYALMNGYAIYLLLIKQSNEWFKKARFAP